ncbi:serine/threonine-protein kinase [Actinocrispum wychmicini]|uniref:non-specific serine/threonine protein kinase n=2 Tax=Actinocrispum wychmicini TaxID=1213861 RepID=A0A4V2S4F6_9PSEU|nr:Stk1 family PASTA domain-containing Ser/Thr kinase [Actinocrispum wychmicini]TCO48110.1 serine/threonine-protein kinase [Actinocrispum wychmicini]
MATLLEQRYRVDAPLARGGMSAVYRGMDMRLERPVAIKVMDQRFAEDRSFVDRFEREARAAASLHHPNVIAVHDQGLDGDHVFLVMELVDGGTLRDLLTERGRLTVPLALSVLEPVLSALAAAHKAGLVHRDVKPENVLIGRQGTVKVGDFGLVKAMASAGTTSNSVILGTVAYLSPEQVTTGATTASGDVYSAGILLFEMLTGVPPYTGDTALSVAWRHVNDDVPPPSRLVPGIPPAVDELVLRATRRDPAMRPQDAAAFLHELEQVRAATGSPVVAVPSSGHGEQTMPATPQDFPTVQVRPLTARNPVTVGGPGPKGTRAMLRSDLDGMARPLVQRDPPPSSPPTTLPPQSRRKRRFPVPIWAIVVVFIGGLVAVGFFMFGGEKLIAVPTVIGKDNGTAVQAVQDLGLQPNVQKQRSDTVSKNKVIGSQPAAGSQVKKGSTVTLTVSDGPPTVPNIAPGATKDTATQAIKEQGLVPIDGDGQYDDRVAAGTVLQLTPSPGTQLQSGGKVEIVLSKGPAPLQPLPDVRGKTVDDAKRTLNGAGYANIVVQTTFDPQTDGGKVISTDPTAGNTPQDKKVTLLVSNAVNVPQLVGMRIGDARELLKGLGLQLKVGGFDFPGGGGGGGGGRGRDRDDRQIVFQDPGAGNRVSKGTTIQVVPGFGF